MQISTCHQQEHKICEQKSIILDNGSTMSIFHDRELVNDVVKADNPIKIVTNAGTRIVSEQAMVAGFGKVWFDEQAIANIFALADLKKKYHVTYDPAIEDAFILNCEIKEPHKLRCIDHGIYVFTLPVCHKDKKDLAKSHLVDTVKENRLGYTKSQFDKAVKARTLYHELDAPTIENYKAFIRMGGVQYGPVRVEDIKIAENIFGPDMATLKGKRTRKTPKPVLD